MADIVVSEFMDEEILREVLAGFDVIYEPRLAEDRDELLRRVVDVKAIIVRNRTQVDAELLASAANLTAVGRLGVGLDNIDLERCNARGITVYPASGANDVAVAEYVMSAAFVLLRNVWFAQERMLAGEWPRTETIGREVFGKRMGLVGFGAIARQVAGRAKALGMQVAAFDPHLADDDPAWRDVERQTFEALLQSSDVVSVHVPLTQQTKHLLDRAAIARMRTGSVLINTARGGVVDEAALVEALEAHCLGGAALDVFATEPLDAAARQQLAKAPNLLLTPHIAGITEESNLRVSRVTAENVAKHLR